MILTFPRITRRWAGLTSIVLCAKGMVGHSRVTTHVIIVVLTRMVLRSGIVGAQVGSSPIRRGPRVQILCSLCTPKSRRPYANIRTRTKNAAHVNRIVIATLTTVPEGAGQTTLGNDIYVRNIN